MNSMRSKGQALVETLLTTVMLTVVVFAAIQFCVIIVNMLIANEAAFSVSRVAVVAANDEALKKNTQWAALFLLARHVSLGNFQFIPDDIPVDKKTLAACHKTEIQAYNAHLKYSSNIMFGRFLGGSRIYSIGTIHLLKGAACSRMIKSPDEKYYNKAYPDAAEFN